MSGDASERGWEIEGKGDYCLKHSSLTLSSIETYS